MKQKPSSRATAHLTLSLGMVTVPISVYTGKDAKSGTERHKYLSVPVMEAVEDYATGEPFLDRGGKPILVQKTVEVVDESPDAKGAMKRVPVFEDHPVGNGNIDKVTGELLPAGTEVTMKYTTEYGPVFVEDHEVEDLFEITPDTLEIKEFKPLALFHQGQYPPRDTLFVEPRKTGSGSKKAYDKNFLKALATIFEGMRKEGVFGLCEMTTRGVPKPAALLSDGTLWLLHHTDSLRTQRELPEVSLVDAEVNMMRTFIKSMKVDEFTEVNDVRSALIQAFADEKAAAGDFAKPVEEEVEEVEVVSTPGLMDMLAASVEAAEQQRKAG